MEESDEGRDADDVEVFERPPAVGWSAFGKPAEFVIVLRD